MNFRIVWMGSDDDPAAQQCSVQQAMGRQSPTLFYEQFGAEMVRCQRLANGQLKRTSVANFTARIVRDSIHENDAEQQRELTVEAKVGGRTLTFVVRAAEFNRMGWVLPHLGPEAIIYPGQQQHARAAIQWLSVAIVRERIFTSLGWHRQGSEWVYVHAGGTIGSHHSCSDQPADLPPSLEHYRLPTPADRLELVGAIRSSLDFLRLACDRISFPLLAATFRAALAPVDFSVFLTGPTGTFKTALAALCQQHFGAAMEASRLPANFASTGNALESLAFRAKDALLVVDDFVLIGGHGDGDLQRLAERLFRAAGNHQGRSRMGVDGRLHASQPPRGLLLATGENVPRVKSIRARLLIVELSPGDVNRIVLSQCQHAARIGQMAAAMGGFLSWVAASYEERQQWVKDRVLATRAHFEGGAIHARLPAALAELQAGWELFLEFAVDVDAINGAERLVLEGRNKTALAELAILQAKYQGSDPATAFMSCLRGALAGGRAHIANRQGGMPESPERWGWRFEATGKQWEPQGARIGWIATGDLFLDPTASYQAAQQTAGTDRLTVSEQTLRHRLHEGGLLASVDDGRQMLMVRRVLDGVLRKVLHLKANELLVP